MCAYAVRVGPNHHVLLVLDRDGWHTTNKLRLPEAIPNLFLPNYSPELQPAGRWGPLLSARTSPTDPNAIADLRDLLVVQGHCATDSFEPSRHKATNVSLHVSSPIDYGHLGPKTHTSSPTNPLLLKAQEDKPCSAVSSCP
jgi:hypothetical protein